MRPLLVIPLLLAGFLEAQPGGAAGTVVDQTGKPLAGVHVRLITGVFDSNGGVNAVYGATSDAAGQFSAEGMKPGLYIVIAERAGFIQAASAASPIGIATLTLKPGQHLTDYKIVLTARSIIAGRVVDEYGDPVENVSVQTESAPADRPHVNVIVNSNATTDDRGEFRLITAPGKYYLKAVVFNQQAGPAEIRIDGTSSAPYTTTYYPGAATTGAASVVQVGAGQDVAGIDIRLMHAGATPATRAFTISGVVMGAPENAQAGVMLRSGENAGQMYGSHITTAASDGKFSFTGMPPGLYGAMAFFSDGKTSLSSRPVSFHLEGVDETGLQLSLEPGAVLTGTLVVVGDAPAGEPRPRTVRLEAVDMSNPMGQTEPHAAEVGQDGSFRIANILPGKFRPVVEPMPENSYLKEVALDGKAVSGRVLDLSQGVGGSQLKITVSRTGGQISGRVLGKDGEPALGLAIVFLTTDPKHPDDNTPARVMDGKYSFKALRPGKYRLCAIDVLEFAEVFAGGGENDDTLQRLFDAAGEIEVKEGDRISKDIPAWTKMPEKKEANAPHR